MGKTTNAITAHITDDGAGNTVLLFHDPDHNAVRYTMSVAEACRFAGRLLNTADRRSHKMTETLKQLLTTEDRKAEVTRSMKAGEMTEPQARRAVVRAIGGVYRRADWR